MKSAPTATSAGFNPLDAGRMLRSAGGALFTQATLHGQLARVEWAEEKSRLLSMLAVALLGFAGLLSAMLLFAALVLALCWETVYRVPAAITLLAIYGFGTYLAWQRFQVLSTLSAETFAATREEFAADAALLKDRL